jgi:hypothetical protein
MNDAEAEQGRMIKIREGASCIIVFKTAKEMQLYEVASILFFFQVNLWQIRQYFVACGSV